MQIGNILIPLDWNERIFTACRLRFLTTSTHFIHPHSPGGKNGCWGKKRQDISPRDAVERYDMRYAVLFDAGGFLGKGFRLKEKLVHLVDFDVVGIGHRLMTYANDIKVNEMNEFFFQPKPLAEKAARIKQYGITHVITLDGITGTDILPLLAPPPVFTAGGVRVYEVR